MGPVIYFQTTGLQTIRIQTREDGFSIDQIVLSPQSYLNSSPGALKNDNTILPKSGATPAIMLVRQPYLQQVTNTSAIVVWATREPGPAEVRYWIGNSTPLTSQATTTIYTASATSMAFDYYQHEAAIGNLSAATTYNYDIYTGGIDATPGVTDHLTTAPATGTGDVRFIAFGDSGIGSTAQRNLAALMPGETFDIAIHGGDVVYGTSSTTGGGWYPQYHNWFFDIYKDWLRSRPVFPSIGNHDDSISRALAYRSLFVLPDNGASSAFPDHAERYYSFDYGPIHFIALDTEFAFQNATRRQEQLNWLVNDLSSTNQPWRVAFFHRSPYSSGGEHGSDLAVRQAFAPIFQQHGVQLVISAHEHVYERTVPWKEATGGSQAVTYIVAGGGGARLYPSSRNVWTASSRSDYHYVRGYISGCQLTLETVGLNGAVFDRFTLDKCEQEADASPPTVSLTSPAANETVSGDTLLQSQAGDDVRVEKVDFFIDGALAGIDLSAPYQYSWNTRTASDGSHTIEARVYDIAGNWTSTGVRPVIVSNSVSPPQGEIVLYASEAGVRAGNCRRGSHSSPQRRGRKADHPACKSHALLRDELPGRGGPSLPAVDKRQGRQQ
jgi:hypothetical protein